MESRLLDPSVKVSCGSGMDTCVEALGLGSFGDTTFQGCASTGSGFKPPESIAQGFSLTFNDVKKNGCMSREEIQKKRKNFHACLEETLMVSKFASAIVEIVVTKESKAKVLVQLAQKM